MITKEDALAYHRDGRPGKLEVVATKRTITARDLSLAYTPGVAEPLHAWPKSARNRATTIAPWARGSRPDSRANVERGRLLTGAALIPHFLATPLEYHERPRCTGD